MEYPRFLVVEASNYEEDAYPVAASWSIADGQLKSVLIRPEDEWDKWEPSSDDRHGITREQIELVGETVLDVIREINDDVDKCPVYVSDPYMYQLWLSTMYQSYGAEIPFDIYHNADLFKMGEEALEEELSNLASNLLLDLRVPEERVRTLLELYHRLTNSSLL